MINYNVLENENTLDDEENKAANIPTDDIAVETGTEAENGNAIQPDDNEPEVEDTPSNKVDIKEDVDFLLGNNKLGYNIWDTIVKGV